MSDSSPPVRRNRRGATSKRVAAMSEDSDTDFEDIPRSSGNASKTEVLSGSKRKNPKDEGTPPSSNPTISTSQQQQEDESEDANVEEVSPSHSEPKKARTRSPQRKLTPNSKAQNPFAAKKNRGRASKPPVKEEEEPKDEDEDEDGDDEEEEEEDTFSDFEEKVKAPDEDDDDDEGEEEEEEDVVSDFDAGSEPEPAPAAKKKTNRKEPAVKTPKPTMGNKKSETKPKSTLKSKPKPKAKAKPTPKKESTSTRRPAAATPRPIAPASSGSSPTAIRRWRQPGLSQGSGGVKIVGPIGKPGSGLLRTVRTKPLHPYL